MAHILCITTGFTGIRNSSFEVVSRLQKAGYRVTYASALFDLSQTVTNQGFTYQKIPTFSIQWEQPNEQEFKGLWGKVRKQLIKLTKASQRHQILLDRLKMDEFIAIVKNLNPDLILCDQDMPMHIMALVSQGMPIALLSAWFSTWKRPGLPHISLDVIPGFGWRGHPLGIEWDWLRIRLRRWLSLQIKRPLIMGPNSYSILYYYAQQLKFPYKQEAQLYEWLPLSFRSLPVLSMTAWEMEFPHLPRPGMFYIGPMVYSQLKETSLEPEIMEQLQDIFSNREKTGRPLIYCSVSTMNAGDQEFLKRLTEAVARKPEWNLILSLGGKLEPDFLAPLPANIHSFSWVPQLEVLKHADCSINHGGINTINECIHFQVPMVVYSGKQHDQNGCAARVAYHGLGLMGDKDQDNPQQICDRINRILTESSFRNAVEQMHSYYKIYQQENRLLQVIDRLFNALNCANSDERNFLFPYIK